MYLTPLKLSNYANGRHSSTLPLNTVAPSISGTNQVGYVLTAVNGTYTGTAPIVITGIWQRDGVDITGETSLTYTQVTADIGTSITWHETGTNDYGSAVADSNAIATTGTAPQFTANPVITGTLEVGQTLTCSDGTVTGTEPITYSYQWYRGVTPIGADQNTYIATGADATFSITCKRTATNVYGSDNATSAAVVILAYTPSYALHWWNSDNAAIVGTTMTFEDTGSVGGLDVTNPDVPSLPTISNRIVEFNGTTQYLKRTVSNFRSGDTTGVLHCYIKHASGVNAFPFSYSKNGSNDYRCHTTINTSNNAAIVHRTTAQVNDISTTAYGTGMFLLSVVQNGTNNIILIDGVEVAQTDGMAAQWFNLLAGQSQTLSFGAIISTAIFYANGGIRAIGYSPYTSKAAAIAEAQDIIANVQL